MDTCDIRLECLKLAQAHRPDYPVNDIVDLARAYADFILARRDGSILHAAHEVAKAVNQ